MCSAALQYFAHLGKSEDKSLFTDSRASDSVENWMVKPANHGNKIVGPDSKEHISKNKKKRFNSIQLRRWSQWLVELQQMKREMDSLSL